MFFEKDETSLLEYQKEFELLLYSLTVKDCKYVVYEMTIAKQLENFILMRKKWSCRNAMVSVFQANDIQQSR